MARALSRRVTYGDAVLSRFARVTFRDAPERLEALFAEPDAIQTHVRPRRRGKKQAGGAGEGGEGGAVKTATPKRRARRRYR